MIFVKVIELLIVCGDYITWPFIEQTLHCQVEIWSFSLSTFPCRNQGGHRGGGAWLQVHTWGWVSYQSAWWWSLVCYLTADPSPNVNLTSTWRHSHDKCSQASVFHSPTAQPEMHGVCDTPSISQNNFRLLLRPFLHSSGTVGTGEPVHFTEYGGLPHFRSLNCTQAYVYAFWTKQSACNIIDGHFSRVSVRWGSTVQLVHFWSSLVQSEF